MKLDKIKFARVVKFITDLRPEHHFDIEELDSLIDINVEPVPLPHAAFSDVNELLKAIKANEKINAIKAYRTLTGMGLKESKDTIEEFWPDKLIVK